MKAAQIKMVMASESEATVESPAGNRPPVAGYGMDMNERRRARAAGVCLAAILVGGCGPDSRGTDADTPADTVGELEDAGARSDALDAERGASVDPWREARDRGATFRGLGQEPGWIVEFYPSEGRIHVLADYGELEFDAPLPEPETDPDTGARIYRTSSGARVVTVTIRDETCYDGMSGFEFPRIVLLAIDGRELRGCGRPLE